MVGDLWNSVVKSLWFPELAALGMPFMMALWMYLCFHCCWVFIWWVLPSSCLTVGQSSHHVLYAVVQVLSEQNQSPGNKPTSAKISPLPYNLSVNSKWTSINKIVKRLRLLKEKGEIMCSTNSNVSICTNLLDIKSILKSYAGKKMSLIMEKTTVGFFLVAFRILHYFFLSRSTFGDIKCWPQLTPPVVSFSCQFVTLHSAFRLNPHRVGQNPSWDWGYFYPWHCCCLWGECSAWAGWLFQCG